VHELAATLLDVAGEAGGEFVQVALDVQDEDGPGLDGLDPLLGGRRPVEDAQDDAAGPGAVPVAVEFVLDRLQVQPVEVAHTGRLPGGGKKLLGTHSRSRGGKGPVATR
jgi:hypothetical protein